MEVVVVGMGVEYWVVKSTPVGYLYLFHKRNSFISYNRSITVAAMDGSAVCQSSQVTHHLRPIAYKNFNTI